MSFKIPIFVLYLLHLICCYTQSPTVYTSTNFYLVIGLLKNYTDAINYCQTTYGSSLPDIKSLARGIELNNLISSASPDEPVWVHYDDKVTEGLFVWSDGSTGNYTNWYLGEPNNNEGNEDCVELQPAFDNTWNDHQCSKLNYFACSNPNSGSVCDIDNGNFTVNWEIEFGIGEDSKINSNVVINNGYDENGKIEISVDVIADYKVNAIYPSITNDEFGITYVLDTKLFENSGRYLKSANLCENRLENDFNSLNFEDYWTYTNTPSNNLLLPGSNGIGMEYPKSNWSLEVYNSQPCNQVKWNRIFSFDELSHNCAFTWDNSDENYIKLTGAFYLTLVSPNPLTYDSINDAGQYLTKSLKVHPLTITFRKDYSIVSSAFVDLFGAYISSTIFDEDLQQFKLVITTYVPNYLQILDISNIELNTLSNLTWVANEDTSYTGECLKNDQYRCWQTFILTTTIDHCPSNGYIFDNEFTLFTTLGCYINEAENDPESACYEFLYGENDQESNINVDIGTLSLGYTELCDSTLYDISFTGELNFYQSASFLSIRDTVNNPYRSNGEIVYIQINIDEPIDTYSIFGVNIVSVILCTADVDDSTMISGCSDNTVDISLTYDITNDQALNFELINSDTTDNFEQFSFNLPTIADDRFFIEVIVELTLNVDQNIRRRVLLQNKNANKFQSHVASGSVDNSESGNKNSNGSNDKNLLIGIITGALAIIFALTSVIVYIKVIKSKENKILEVKTSELVTTNVNTQQV